MKRKLFGFLATLALGYYGIPYAEKHSDDWLVWNSTPSLEAQHLVNDLVSNTSWTMQASNNQPALIGANVQIHPNRKLTWYLARLPEVYSADGNVNCSNAYSTADLRAINIAAEKRLRRILAQQSSSKQSPHVHSSPRISTEVVANVNP